MAEETENIAEAKPRSLQPIILTGLLAAILGGVIGILGTDYMSGEETTDGSEAAASATAGAAKAPSITADTTTYELGDFSINLKDPSTMRILQMSIVLECDTALISEIEQSHAQLRDSVNMFASEYTVTSLAGMEGKMNLRDEILMRINSILKPDRVERVYFTKFIIGK